jgi:hypothetical protein
MSQTPERNSPCPCGSGKKYKKCCMLKSSGAGSQIPFTLSNQANQSSFPFSHKPPQNSNPEQPDTIKITENNTTTEDPQTAGNNISAIKLLDMSTAAEVIEKLGMDDLRTLNKLIVDRINFVVKSKNDSLRSNFSPGNKVQFKTKIGDYKHGVVIRVNQKTVSVAIEGETGWWNVSPHALERM